MQGVWIDDHRPKTKKVLKGTIGAGRSRAVSLQATSMFGNEYDGPLNLAPEGTYTVVGPDPYHARNWYATIVVGPGETITVK